MLRLRYHCGSIASCGSSPKLVDSPDMMTIGTSASIAECMPAEPLQEAGAGMQQHRLHPPGHLRVAHRHVDGQGLVPAIDVGGTRLLIDLLAGERLPHRRPFGAGRGDDVVEAEAAKRLEDRLAAVAILFHPRPP